MRRGTASLVAGASPRGSARNRETALGNERRPAARKEVLGWRCGNEKALRATGLGARVGWFLINGEQGEGCAFCYLLKFPESVFYLKSPSFIEVDAESIAEELA